MRFVDARGRRTYFLRIIESVRPDELHMAVLHIRIENQAGNIVPLFRATLYTRCQIRFKHDGSPVGNDFIRCRGQGIRVQEINIDEDVLYVRLNCRKD